MLFYTAHQAGAGSPGHHLAAQPLPGVPSGSCKCSCAAVVSATVSTGTLTRSLGMLRCPHLSHAESLTSARDLALQCTARDCCHCWHARAQQPLVLGVYAHAGCLRCCPVPCCHRSHPVASRDSKSSGVEPLAPDGAAVLSHTASARLPCMYMPSSTCAACTRTCVHGCTCTGDSSYGPNGDVPCMLPLLHLQRRQPLASVHTTGVTAAWLVDLAAPALSSAQSQAVKCDVLLWLQLASRLGVCHCSVSPPCVTAAGMCSALSFSLLSTDQTETRQLELMFLS